MAQLTLSPTVVVEFDERVVQLAPAAVPPPPARRLPGRVASGAPTPLSGAGAGSTAEAFAGMLVQRGVVRSADAAITFTPAASAAAARRSGPAGPTRLHVSLPAGEQAVVLTESDGVLAWRFPQAAVTGAPATPRAAPAAASARVVVFEVDAAPAVPSTPGTAHKRSWISDQIVGGLKAVVLYFAAEWAIDRVVAVLERNGRDGPVVIDSPTDVSTWSRPNDFAQLKLPPKARVLLLVHGTFSSTAGGFGGLTATPWGQKLLTGALGRYNAVIGFDHRSLSLTPEQNAQALLDALRTLPCEESVVDIVCHSRGGLVVRTLVERLLPPSGLRCRVPRAIFVAATHNGTELARPANWESMVDLVTNLAAVTKRVISLFPAAAPAALVAEEVIASICEFVKYLVQAAIDDRHAPGIAAMEPGGAIVRELNRTQEDQPTSRDIDCYAIVSNFRSRIGGNDAHEPAEFPRRLAMLLADGAIDRLMQGSRPARVANDLVVDVASMTDIDSAVGGFVKDVLDFGDNASVYHTNYFLRPETAGRIAQWLQLPSPLEAMDSVVLAGASRNLMTVDANMSVGAAQAMAAGAKPGYLVLTRQDPRETRRSPLFYAIKPAELLDLTRHANAATPLATALNLHESEQSSKGDSDADMQAVRGAGVDPMRPYSTRGVMLSASGRPLGVVEATSSRIGLPELAFQASAPAVPAPAAEPLPTTRRGIPPVLTTPPAPLDAELATARMHTLAEMPNRVALRATALVKVTISREQLFAAAGQAGAASTFETELTPGAKLIVDVVPRSGFDYPDDDTTRGRSSVPVPLPGEPAEASIALVATEVGEGMVTVTIRRSSVQCLQLSLRCSVTETSVDSRGSVASSAPMAEPDLPLPCASLTIFERRNNGQLQFEYILDAGTVYDRFVSKPIAVDLQQYVTQTYERIENAWAASDRSIARFEKDMVGWGGTLFRQLFPIELQRKLWQFAQSDDTEGVRVLSDEPFIPWETVFICDPDDLDSKEGKFFAELGICRWLYGATSPTAVDVRPRHARYVIPHYPDQAWRLPNAEGVEEPYLRSLGAESVSPMHAEVMALLEEPGSVDLLHFACHGSADAGQIDSSALWLQGEVLQQAGQPAWAKESLLASTVAQFARLRGADGRRPLVVVNACQTGQVGRSLTGIGGFASAFIGPREGTGDSRGRAAAFVGALWSVGDAPAATFVKAFYRELRDGRSISGASRIARNESRAAGEPTWLAYAIYAHPMLRVRWK